MFFSLFSLSLLFLSLLSCVSFRWNVDDILDPTQILTLSERFMFSSHDGPLLLSQGESYIDIQTEAIIM